MANTEKNTKKTIFRGVATALITPMDENGVNYEQLGRLIDWQIEKGINALVISGTTGGSSTMTDDEHRNVIEYAVKRAADQNRRKSKRDGKRTEFNEGTNDLKGNNCRG